MILKIARNPAEWHARSGHELYSYAPLIWMKISIEDLHLAIEKSESSAGIGQVYAPIHLSHDVLSCYAKRSLRINEPLSAVVQAQAQINLSINAYYKKTLCGAGPKM